MESKMEDVLPLLFVEHSLFDGPFASSICTFCIGRMNSTNWSWRLYKKERLTSYVRALSLGFVTAAEEKSDVS